jgi:hypothetical protein
MRLRIASFNLRVERKPRPSRAENALQAGASLSFCPRVDWLRALVTRSGFVLAIFLKRRLKSLLVLIAAEAAGDGGKKTEDGGQVALGPLSTAAGEIRNNCRHHRPRTKAQDADD